MDDAASPAANAGPASGGRVRRPRPAFAALDLGTNNCRLLVAEPAGAGFRIIDGYSQIVRLGEGVAATGRLGAAAMERALAALQVCADKIAQRPVEMQRCVATQACRTAANGAEFLATVTERTGLNLEVIPPSEEAQLAVQGCAALLDPHVEMGIVVDIGGGSTEVSFVNPRRLEPDGSPTIIDWVSTPFGVVTLAETHGPSLDDDRGYEALVGEITAALLATSCARFAPIFRAGGGHLVGTSGTVTSLAGVHLDLDRYRRAKVDGLWMTVDEVRAAAARLRAAGPKGRAAHPCIGPDRGDLVAPGAAILEAVVRAWPVQRVRVADRGLREGMLMQLMRAAGAFHRRRTDRQRA